MLRKNLLIFLQFYYLMQYSCIASFPSLAHVENYIYHWPRTPNIAFICDQSIIVILNFKQLSDFIVTRLACLIIVYTIYVYIIGICVLNSWKCYIV